MKTLEHELAHIKPSQARTDLIKLWVEHIKTCEFPDCKESRTV